ncbi:MAG: hypothetical protein FD166_3807 [Bacteroidetes bacterium]|nr:MAG: hypothetical protein FD166_3807 [Bacteroidota bacterium]
MSDVREIREALQRIYGKSEASAFTAEVTAVSSTECSVKLGDLVIDGVKLYSIDGAGKYTIKPATGSMVTVLDLSNGKLRDLCLVKVDKPELIKFEMNGLTLELDALTKKVDVSSGAISLKSLFDSVATIIEGLKVSVLAPNSTSGPVLPDTIVLVNKFKMDVNALLK